MVFFLVGHLINNFDDSQGIVISPNCNIDFKVIVYKNLRKRKILKTNIKFIRFQRNYSNLINFCFFKKGFLSIFFFFKKKNIFQRLHVF